MVDDRTAAAPIGRRNECESTARFLDQVATGQGGVLLLEGEGGTGKTTLAEWTLDQARQRDMATLTGRSWEMSQSVPYEPVVAALGRFLRTADPAERTRLTSGLSSLATLIDGLDVGAPTGVTDVSRARLHDAVATLLARIAAERPAVFFIDDLHWSDVSSLELLQFVCRDFPFVSLGIIGTVRPADADEREEVRGFLATLRRTSFCSSVSVRNLDRTETIELLTERLGGDPPDRLVDLVWARSIGTPLLVHEMVEDLKGRDVLVREPYGWTLTDPDPPLPRAAADLIQHRIDRAQPTERSLLDILAVADEPTSLDVIVAVSGLEPSQAEERLRRLIQIRLVAEIGDAGDQPRWHVEHPIIGHVVASDLDRLVLQRLHRQLLAASPDASVARRARHVVGGGPPVDPIAAVETLIEAADVAYRQGATAQAIIDYEAAEAIAESIEDQRANPLLLEIHQGLGLALTRARRMEEAIVVLEKAWDRAVALDLVDEQIRAITSIDSGTFLAGNRSGIVLDRLEGLATRFEEARDWDRLIEVRFQQFLIVGRNGQLDAVDYIYEALGKAKDLVATPRTRQLVDLLELSQWFAKTGPREYGDELDQLIEIALRPGEWDLRRRAGLMALDLAAHIGPPELIDRAIGATRSVESEIGERPNWRIPVQRAILAVGDGQERGPMEDLLQVGQVERSRTMISIIGSMEHRYRYGPEAALRYLDERVDVDSLSDRVARIYAVLGRVVLAEGSDRLVHFAEQALDAPLTPGLFTMFSIAQFDLASVLAASVAGSEDDAADALQGLGRRIDGPSLPDAWRAIALSHRTSGADRAALLLQAADHLDACALRLEAAHRRIEAAEHDRACVPDDVLAEAGAFARACGAGWVADRAASLSPGSPTLPADPPDDSLTKREWEVATEVARGLTNREVAQELFISIRTVTSHLDHIYTKLGFSSREELTDYVADTMANT